MTENTFEDKYIGKLFDDRYQILNIIGEGGMAVVYRALDTKLSRNVAIKILREEYASSPEFIERFESESHAIAMMSHPNIVSVYDVGNYNRVEFIVMELVNGITLKQYMERKSMIPWKEVLHFSKQIAAGLNHAHQHGIVHRDIKPQNIMLLKDGTIKVADFGIASLDREINFDENEALGSINYMAPEIARGQNADARCDIYSLGITMYEMVCGRKPYSGTSIEEILIAQLSQNINSIKSICPEVPDELVEIINKAMDPNRDTRYLTSSELLEDLEAFTIDFIKASKEKPNEVDNFTSEQIVKKENTEKKSIKKVASVKSTKRRASVSLSAFGLMLCIVLCFTFIWKYWLSDIFATAERIVLPSFEGYNFNEIESNTQLTQLFNFTPNYIVDTTTAAGTVLSQDPEAGRSLMINKDGIDVTLNISTGYVLAEVPNVTGINYREASLLLTNAGFTVELNNVSSESIPKDEVISTSPSAGESISSESTVYVYVSGGKEMLYIKMPNVVGLSEEAAINKITNSNLTFAGTVRQSSEYEEGTVISQSTPAFAEVQERTNITITVSDGTYIEPYMIGATASNG